jgi:ligand-binding sensor domain-containing protein/signal transduction histidine kinase
MKERWFRRLFLTGAVFLGVLLAHCALALDPSRDLLQYNCQTWSRLNGLPVNGINAISQTRDGGLWLGTVIGLVRYNGTDFKLLDLGRVSQEDSSSVNSLSSARDGGLWVGLENSSFGYCDGKAFSFRSSDGWAKVDPKVWYVNSILEGRDGTVWIGAVGAALRQAHPGQYEEVLGSSTNAEAFGDGVNVRCCYEDSKGRIWFGTVDDGIYCWQAGKVTKLSNPNLDEKAVLCLAEDKEGQMWVGTLGGLYCFDSNLRQKDIPPLPMEIRALLVDREGVLWIGTAGQGLVRYQNGAYTFLRKTDGLANDYVKALMEDTEGSLWVGTVGGLSQLTDVKFKTQPAAENPDVKDAIAVCASKKGGIWVGSSSGLSYFDGKIKTYGREAGLTDPYVKRVFEASDGDVYLVSGIKNLVVFSGDHVVATYPAPDMVVGLAEDAHGAVASVGGTLYRVGRDYFTPYVFANGPPNLDWVLNMAQGRDGEIWVACVHGIFRIKDGMDRQWKPAEGLVQWICEDSDRVVWGASLNGIVRLKDGAIRSFQRKDGLLDNNIYSIVPDDLGNLWIDSARGIFKVSRKSLNDYAAGPTNLVECIAYDGPEAVKPSDKTTQEHVACKTADGRIWFPSANGVVEIDPAHIPSNRIPPPVQIDSLRANGVEMKLGGGVVVPPGAGELEIRFSALSFIAPRNVVLRYRLEGYDKDWVEIKGRHLVFYTNLKPGHYRFRVTAANADGVWNEIGDSAEITLQPHYYETVWFEALCVALGCAGVAAIFAWRLQQLKVKQAELQQAHQLLEFKVSSRTAELARANTSLQDEIAEHKQTEIELKRRTLSLEIEIEERARMQKEVERVHKELLQTSRLAGMSEIATNVLHNVGNVLNSVNISATVVSDSIKNPKLGDLAKVAAMLKEHEKDLGAFITIDPKGRQVPPFLAALSEHLLADQAASVKELELLRRNIEHIKEIVSMQQSYARIAGVKEIVNVQSLVEDSLRLNVGNFDLKGVKVVCDFQKVPPVNAEKHKILQILVNLLRNAKYACDESGRADKEMTVRVTDGGGRLKISVIDNGVGIAPENLTRIFSHGFTTRKDGHGFGLHAGALAAREMGGALTVQSDGLGKGASFTLELPIQSEPANN